ncbi:MAG: VOC family protein [Ardenticatenaceae bacterium]|nr:VOC family protein [Ardenticatenaceae bacterium]
MIGVSTVSVFVADQQRAKSFYTDVLGMELRNDAPLYPGSEKRWIAVAPAGSQTEIILYEPDENWAHYKQVIGKPQNITIAVKDIASLYEELSAKGVSMDPPDPQPWGTFSFLRDSEGNSLLLVQNA